MINNYLAALQAAAQAKGGVPLTDEEKAEVYKACQKPEGWRCPSCLIENIPLTEPCPYCLRYREDLRQRFLAVIRLAGYGPNAAEGILAEWFDKYMTDIPGFEAMLKEYEDSNGHPD